MKKSLVILVFLLTLMGAYNNNAQAQVQLGVEALINFPDTAIVGQAYPIAIRVKNIGNTPYQGPLQIGLMRDSLFAYLYFNSNPAVVIFPNDTLTLYTTNTGLFGFVFDSTVFRPGNNVVVVWPYSNQGIIADSLTTNVYVEFPTSVNNILNDDRFTLYPNPFNDKIIFSGINSGDIEHVRIFTLQGVLVYDKKLLNNYLVPEKLPQGCYLLDAETRNKNHRYWKIMKN